MCGSDVLQLWNAKIMRPTLSLTALTAVLMVSTTVSALSRSARDGTYFIHLSDPHVDFGYKEGTPTECALRSLGWPCCHAQATNRTPCALAPRFGHPNCDAPRETVQRMIEQTALRHPRPAVVLLTGDLTSHDAFRETPERIAKNWDWLLTVVEQNFGRGVPVVATLGNHDVFPADQASEDRADTVLGALLPVLRAHGVLHAGERDEDAFAQRGFYRAPIAGTRVDAVVMNNILDLERNRLSRPETRDPGGMYAFVADAVARTAAAGRHVWLVGHVAPALAQERARGAAFAAQLLEAFGANGTVTGAFFGHTHHDQFFLVGLHSLADAAAPGRAAAVAVVAPGATPLGGIRPSIRVVDCDPQTLAMLDWHQYHVDIDRANREGAVTLEHAYDFRAAYGVPDLSTASFHDIARRCLRNETLAVTFLNNMATRPGASSTCDAACRKNLFCSIAFAADNTLNKECLNAPLDLLLKITSK